MKLKKIVLGISLSLVVNSTAHAEISDMQSFFNEVGVYGNATPANAFAGQTRNYVTGGSLSVRIPQKNYQLATISPPRLSASCGGIDAFAGSFSFINSEQLVQMLQNIGNNAAGAIFQLALDSVSPKLGGIMKYFQDMANKVNALNVNSCEAAKGIVVAGQSGSLEGGYLNDLAEKGKDIFGVASDWSGIKEAWQKNPAEVSNTKTTALNSPALTNDEKFWIEPGNLLWRALDKVTYNGSGFTDDEKKILQALVGTVIIKEGSNAEKTLEATGYDSLIEDPLSYLMGTDTSTDIQIPVYTCNNSTSCDVITTGTEKVTVKSLRKIIHQKIKTTQDKIQNRSGGITADDYAVVNMSFLPIWTMMEADYRTGGILGTLDSSEEVIALSYTKALLERSLKGVKLALQSAKKAKNEGIALAVKDLGKSVTEVSRRLDSSMEEKLLRYTAFLTAKENLAREVNRVKERTAQQLVSINRR